MTVAITYYTTGSELMTSLMSDEEEFAEAIDVLVDQSYFDLVESISDYRENARLVEIAEFMEQFAKHLRAKADED